MLELDRRVFWDEQLTPEELYAWRKWAGHLPGGKRKRKKRRKKRLPRSSPLPRRVSARFTKALGAGAVVALERSPCLTCPRMFTALVNAVFFPMLAKCRIGHFVEAHFLLRGLRGRVRDSQCRGRGKLHHDVCVQGAFCVVAGTWVRRFNAFPRVPACSAWRTRRVMWCALWWLRPDGVFLVLEWFSLVVAARRRILGAGMVLSGRCGQTASTS